MAILLLDPRLRLGETVPRRARSGLHGLARFPSTRAFRSGIAPLRICNADENGNQTEGSTDRRHRPPARSAARGAEDRVPERRTAKLPCKDALACRTIRWLERSRRSGRHT